MEGNSGLDAKFDPFKEPNVVQMNYERRWRNHLEHYMQMEGEAENWLCAKTQECVDRFFFEALRLNRVHRGHFMSDSMRLSGRMDKILILDQEGYENI